MGQAEPPTLQISISGTVWTEKYTEQGNTRQSVLTIASKSKFMQWDGEAVDVSCVIYLFAVI